MKPSKKQVKKAGETLAADPKDSTAMEVLSQWRSLHAYPINAFQPLIRKHISKLGLKETTVAQRLKRTPSIIKKIQRFDGMNLARMQDIGGLRVIVKTIDDVYRLHNSLISGKHQHKPLLPPKDYIKQPKADGYRSLHQVFKYSATTHSESDELNIELQIRTQLQHYWATAVEILGLIENASIKTGGGSDEHKRFFKLASVLFAKQECTVIDDDFTDVPTETIIQEIKTIEQKLQVFQKLQSWVVSSKHITSTKTTGENYYLMQLDTVNKTLSLTPFSKMQADQAENIYKLLEIQNVDRPHIELVLISTKDLKEIKKAYPNYFLDSHKFIKHLKQLL
ncbi:RelA/SpoT domain-containing protein [Moraxella sp. ZJ142]|uniref:RelA/SpoT domain-containing protein n=1 Tax=Moraxella marmotae TaxID=3344520 RepID=UPI0035D416BC